MSDLFLAPAGPSSGFGDASLSELRDRGRRMLLLNQYAPSLVTSSPSAALDMASSNLDDRELLRTAMEASDFADAARMAGALVEDAPSVQRTKWQSYPSAVRQALLDAGYQPPAERRRGANRWGIDLPDKILGFDTPDELTIARSTPVLGPVGNIQAGLGEGLEAVRDVTADVGGPVLEAAGAPLRAVQHTLRTLAYVEEEGGFDNRQGLGAIRDRFGQLVEGWKATDESDHYVRPEFRRRALDMLGGDRTAYELAHLALGVSDPNDVPKAINEHYGLTPGSAESQERIAAYAQLAGTDAFADAVAEMSVGQVSVGRGIAQGLGLHDTDAGWGRIVSGTIDGGFDLVLDPTLLAGKFTKAARFGRYAFAVDNGEAVGRGMRGVDMATELVRAERGLRPGVAATGLVSASDVARGRNVARFATHVADRVGRGEWSRLMRDIPEIGPAVSRMHDAHVERLADGLPGLDDSLGVLDWLRSRQGITTLAATRLGGRSAMETGLRVPALSSLDVGRIAAKDYWTRAIDWGRTAYGPGFRDLRDAAGSPTRLARQMGRWTVARGVGDPARVVAALAAHLPYDKALALTGDEAVPEMTRLANLGLFSGLTRREMDAFVDEFVTSGIEHRGAVAERLLERVFEGSGISDTPFARRFVGRHRSSVALGEDASEVADGAVSRSGRLPDAHREVAVPIPRGKDFLEATRKVNLARTIFHNGPLATADAVVGRTWKPSVLMRLGFIPRAAGEELLRYLLQHGPRTWLGAKGAEWAVAGPVRAELSAELSELRALRRLGGDEGTLRSLDRQIAALEGQLARGVAGPAGLVGAARSSVAAWDRMWTQLLRASNEGLTAGALTAREGLGWRERLAAKAWDFEGRGGLEVVSGLEKMANHLALGYGEVTSRLGALAHLPTKAEVGRVMAEHWSPGGIEAARLLLTDDRFARAYAEQIAGSTYNPLEFRQPPGVSRVDLGDDAAPVLTEVALRPVPGSGMTHRLRAAGGDPTAYYNSLLSRINAVTGDRAGHEVASAVLPRFTGGKVAELPGRLGYRTHAGLRSDLNDLWAYAPDEGPTGADLLREARRLADDPSGVTDAERALLGRQISAAARAQRPGHNLLDGDRLVGELASGDGPARHWLLYENVDPALLTDDWGTLRSAADQAAAGRMARPDMNEALRDLAAYAGAPVGVGTSRGVTKVYVPVSTGAVVDLGPRFFDDAVGRIVAGTGFDEARARIIVANVVDNVDSDALRAARSHMGGTVPVASWAASDPRVAKAVIEAMEASTGRRIGWGVLSVPDTAVEASVTMDPHGLLAAATDVGAIDDFTVEPWRLTTVRPTERVRLALDVDGQVFDQADLRETAGLLAHPPTGRVRRWSVDRKTWTETRPAGRTAWFVDLTAEEAARYREALPAEFARRTHAVPAAMTGAELPPGTVVTLTGATEAEALQRAAASANDEVFDVLTTRNRLDVDDDVLHEVLEPALRGDTVWRSRSGTEAAEPGLSMSHLVMGTDANRLPLETYGPKMADSRHFRWDAIVETWFDGPVDRAISSVIRKPMFIAEFGRQIEATRGVADLFVGAKLRAATDAAAARLGLDREMLDRVALAPADERAALVAELATAKPRKGELDTLVSFAGHRRHGLDLAVANARDRAIQRVTPYIDDARVRSAFQSYVGNLVPFHFAEEAFLKRWARTISESPEVLRKLQLLMHGFRTSGLVTRSEDGHDVFHFPLVGHLPSLLQTPLTLAFGDVARVPYTVPMTGKVQYAIPLTEALGAPSVGPLVTAPLEFLSRRFPELNRVERAINPRGADKPIWQYFAPSWTSNTWEAIFGDVDAGRLASNRQMALQTMVANGDYPDETATPAEREEWLDRLDGQTRVITAVQGLMGIVSPTSAQVEQPLDLIGDGIRAFTEAGVPYEQAIANFLAANPDVTLDELTASQAGATEGQPGLAGVTPTEAGADWLDDNAELVAAFPQAAAWLLPRTDADDEFSHRAWTTQLASGLRRRKAPAEVLDDVYFDRAARDYFDARQIHEAQLEIFADDPENRRLENERWSAWSKAYKNMHPVFADQLASPERASTRASTTEQLDMLAADPDAPMPPEMRELVRAFRDYRNAVAGLVGDRRRAVVAERREVTTEFWTWAQWHLTRFPQLVGLWTRVYEDQLRDLDTDAVAPAAA